MKFTLGCIIELLKLIAELDVLEGAAFDKDNPLVRPLLNMAPACEASTALPDGRGI